MLFGRSLAGDGAKENGQLSDELFVFEDVIGDAPGIHGGVFEEFEPVVGAGFEAELFGPGAQSGFVLGWRWDFPLDLAPVAGVVAVFQTELAQAEALLRADLFYELAKNSFASCGNRITADTEKRA